MDYLQKEGVSPLLLDKLSTELSHKGRFKSMITMDGRPMNCTFGDLKSQFPAPSTPMLRNMVHYQYVKQKESVLIKQEKDAIISSIREENDIFNARKRRDVISRRPSLKNAKISNVDFSSFPIEIFTEYWGKFKTFFGHLKKEIDPEDPLNGSPVYNLAYDKYGKFIVTAADDGLVKIWSASNGELLNTLIGHNSDINATSLSDCGTYLASCSNESLIKIWHLETGFPIAAFNDHEGTVCSVNFFNMPVTNKPGEKNKRGLISAADDGTIMVYFEDDYINNGGIYKQNQKKLKLKADDTVKGFCSIDVHPEGFLAAGTSGGSIVVWNKLLDIDTKRIERHRIIKKEHSKDCHLTVWNKEGTKLISASFDGTAKVWPWNKENFESNRHMEALFMLESELGKGTDVKCCAVSWSCRGRYTIASFCKKVSRGDDDNEIIRGNIQVYDLHTNKRTHKFENTYDKGSFENYIFILEAHPYNESIIMSADYDGKIIIWDIEHGHMLNVFIEDCAHLGFPLCQAPILDGKFSPDGLSFCVTNYHGSFSIYGYGERDAFLTTPTEQFFMKEFGEFDLEPTTSQFISLDYGLESHLIEKGVLCSSKKKVYSEEFTEYGYHNTFDEKRCYERSIKALQRKKYESKPAAEVLNTQNCVKALKEKIKDSIRQKTEKALEEFYLSLTDKKSEPSLVPATDTSYHSAKLTTSQIRKLLKSNDGFSFGFDEDKTEWQSQEDKSRKPAMASSRLTEPKTMEVEELSGLKDTEERRRPKSDQDLQEDEESLSIQPRRRRVRRLIPDSAQSYDDDNMMVQSPKSLKEERVEDKAVQRKHRRLILDDEDTPEENTQEQKAETRNEEKSREWMEERFSTIEERPEDSNISLARSQSRELSGRRDRQLANNSSNVRQAISTRNMRASRTRTLQLQQQQQQAQENIEEILCARCGLENARMKCNSGCGRAYHTACTKRNGRENDRGIFNCFFCLEKSRKKEKPNGSKINRAWADKDVNDRNVFLPQVGDYVTYVFQAHEDFILQYFDFLRFSQGEVLPYEKHRSLLQDNICKIINISYQFPLSPRWYKGQLSILMKITLETVESGSLTGNTFKLTFFQSEMCDFILPRELYMMSIHKSLELTTGQEISFYQNGGIKQGTIAEMAPREQGPFPNSHWKLIKLADQPEEIQLPGRKSKKEQNDTAVYISPWEVFWGDLSFSLKGDEDITKEFTDWAIREIQRLYENNTEQYEIFLEEVDKDMYRDYPQIVAFEMNIEKIKRRLANFFYRHKAAIIADIQLIMLNCHEYNEPTSIISIWSKQLMEKMIHVVNPSAVNQPTKERDNSRRKETNRRRTRFQDETRDLGLATKSNLNQEVQNEEKPLPRTRARKLVLEDEEESQEKTSVTKFTYPSLEKQNQIHEDFGRNLRANDSRDQSGIELRGRLRKGLRNDKREEAPPPSHQNEGAIRSKLRRKEMEFMEKMKREEPEEEEQETYEEKVIPANTTTHMTLRHPKPQESVVNAGNNYQSRLRQNNIRNFSHYFEEDPVKDEEIPKVEEQKSYNYNNHNINIKFEPKVEKVEEAPISYPELSAHDLFEKFLCEGIEPTHPEFLDQDLPFQSSILERNRSNEYRGGYNAFNQSPEKKDDDEFFMEDNIEIYADREEDPQPIQNEPQTYIPNINNNSNSIADAWGNMNGKRATYDRRYSSDHELNDSGFGSLFDSDALSNGSPPRKNYRNTNTGDEPSNRLSSQIFKGSDDDSDFEQGPKRQTTKNKRLKI